MCTAATYKTKDFYFGRTLDYDFSYGEEITVVPRKFPLHFCEMGEMKEHYAMIGMAHIFENCPMFYDAVNEKGLGMAGLNFVGNAVYREEMPGKYNVAVHEFISWILGQCESVKEARVLLENVNIIGKPIHETLPTAQIHWIISDCMEAITVESVKEGIRIYDNPVGVLANNPPFDMQMFQLNNYMSLSSKSPQNHFSDKLSLDVYSRGMGGLGLPGDLSSQSRFIRASFVKMNSISGTSEAESVSQFFHILGSVDQPRGCCELDDGKYEVTLFTSCSNATRGIYYYTTYDNHQISAVDMRKEDLDGSELVKYPLITKEQIRWQN